jgi:hypothetical protein
VAHDARTGERSSREPSHALEARLAAAESAAARAQDRDAVENVFSRYMRYHNAYEDERIIDELWVRRGRPGALSQYNDSGVYTDWKPSWLATEVVPVRWAS